MLVLINPELSIIDLQQTEHNYNAPAGIYLTFAMKMKIEIDPLYLKYPVTKITYTRCNISFIVHTAMRLIKMFQIYGD